MELKDKAKHYVGNRTERFKKAEEDAKGVVLSEKAVMIQKKLREYHAPSYMFDICSELLDEKISNEKREFHKSTVVESCGDLFLTTNFGSNPKGMDVDGEEDCLEEPIVYATKEQVSEFFEQVSNDVIAKHFEWLNDINVSET